MLAMNSVGRKSVDFRFITSHKLLFCRFIKANFQITNTSKLNKIEVSKLKDLAMNVNIHKLSILNTKTVLFIGALSL